MLLPPRRTQHDPPHDGRPGRGGEGGRTRRRPQSRPQSRQRRLATMTTTIANDDEDSGGENNVQFGDVYADNSGANTTFEIRTRLIVGGATPGSRSRGVGYARNHAVSLQYLLFPDDDVECEDGIKEEEEEEDDDNDRSARRSSWRRWRRR